MAPRGCGRCCRRPCTRWWRPFPSLPSPRPTMREPKKQLSTCPQGSTLLASSHPVSRSARRGGSCRLSAVPQRRYRRLSSGDSRVGGLRHQRNRLLGLLSCRTFSNRRNFPSHVIRTRLADEGCSVAHGEKGGGLGGSGRERCTYESLIRRPALGQSMIKSFV